jgi:pantetheine-phosphate adenylyltransferase
MRNRVVIYPGSFNPFHEGHANIIRKALLTFDKVIIAVGINPEKKVKEEVSQISKVIDDVKKHLPYNCERVEIRSFSGFLSDYIMALHKEDTDSFCTPEVVAIIRGLRNSQDFEYEKTQQYYNEDLNISVPTLYIISDRLLTHVSSSAIRMIDKIKEAK